MNFTEKNKACFSRNNSIILVKTFKIVSLLLYLKTFVLISFCGLALGLKVEVLSCREYSKKDDLNCSRGGNFVSESKRIT